MFFFFPLFLVFIQPHDFTAAFLTCALKNLYSVFVLCQLCSCESGWYVERTDMRSGDGAFGCMYENFIDALRHFYLYFAV